MQDIKLAQLLSMETIELGLFRGQSWDLGYRALFGGQVLGQALRASQATLQQDMVCHSFHSYFLLPGDANMPVVYDVESVRDGRSFCTRRVSAIQKGKVIFYLTASFQRPEQGMAHQYAEMPEVVAPEALSSDVKVFENSKQQLSERMRQILSYHKPLDCRTVTQDQSDNLESVRNVWIKANEAFAGDVHLNQAALAYASDYQFLVAALQPHGLSLKNKELRLASIDHAMWFHRPFHFDDWLLYSTESPVSGGARGLVRGQFFNRSGQLVASTVQEGLMRKVEEKI